jgi:hypothetical protein
MFTSQEPACHASAPGNLFYIEIKARRACILSKYMPVVESSGLSDIGPVREDNQDSIHLPDGSHPPELGLLFAVADGMGGYTHGAVASALAIQKLAETLYNGNGRPNPKSLRRGVESANLSIYKAAERLGAGRMGTTLTAAYIFNDALHLVHVGDSRAYLIRDQQATCLTSNQVNTCRQSSHTFPTVHINKIGGDRLVYQARYFPAQASRKRLFDPLLRWSLVCDTR